MMSQRRPDKRGAGGTERSPTEEAANMQYNQQRSAQMSEREYVRFAQSGRQAKPQPEPHLQAQRAAVEVQRALQVLAEQRHVMHAVEEDAACSRQHGKAMC